MRTIGEIVVRYDQDESGTSPDGVQEALARMCALAQSTSDDADDDGWLAVLTVATPEAADAIRNINNSAPDGICIITDTVPRRHQVVTLRQIEAAGIPLDGRQGIDEAEHTEMLDDAASFRLAVSPDAVELQVYQVNPSVSMEPAWYPCVAYPQMASGHSMRCRAEQINRAVRSLVSND